MTLYDTWLWFPVFDSVVSHKVTLSLTEQVQCYPGACESVIYDQVPCIPISLWFHAWPVNRPFQLLASSHLMFPCTFVFYGSIWVHSHTHPGRCLFGIRVFIADHTPHLDGVYLVFASLFSCLAVRPISHSFREIPLPLAFVGYKHCNWMMNILSRWIIHLRA